MDERGCQGIKEMLLKSQFRPFEQFTNWPQHEPQLNHRNSDSRSTSAVLIQGSPELQLKGPICTCPVCEWLQLRNGTSTQLTLAKGGRQEITLCAVQDKNTINKAHCKSNSAVTVSMRLPLRFPTPNPPASTN